MVFTDKQHSKHKPNLAPPPPDPNLNPSHPHYKRTTIQFRNFNRKKEATRKTEADAASTVAASSLPGERCRRFTNHHHHQHQHHHHKPKLDTGRTGRPQSENIMNMAQQHHPLAPAVNVETGEVMLDRVFIIDDDDAGALPPPPPYDFAKACASRGILSLVDP